MALADRLELRHLRAFIAVSQTLSFRVAAERLHVSQAPLSRTIAQLEQLLGHRLFDRSRQGVALTPAGVAMLPRAQAVMDAADRATAPLPASPDRAPRGARVGVFFAVHPKVQQQLADTVRATQVEVARTHDLLAGVRSGRLDAALVMLPGPTTGLSVQEVARARLGAAVPAVHPLARKRCLAVADLDAFQKLLFLGRRQNAPLHAHLDAALRARGLTAPRYAVPRDTYAGFAQIAAGQACTLLCEWVQGFLSNGVVMRPLRAADRLEVAIGWVARAPDPAQAREVARLLHSVFPPPPRGRRTI